MTTITQSGAAFMKTAGALLDYERDEALERLAEPEITPAKGIGIGAAIGGAVGGGLGLLTKRPRLGKSLALAGAGLGGGGAIGYAAHKMDAEDRDNSINFLRHYNRQKLRELLMQRFYSQPQQPAALPAE